jgi:hypothetical protein
MSEQAERQLRTRLFEDSGILPGAFVLQKIKVPQPVGFKGQQVEGCALGTFLREDYANLVEKLKKKYRLKNAEIIHPFETIQRRGHIGVFLYITEEKTQGLIINKESFGLTNSFSPGGNRFRDAFQDEFGMVENIAEEFERKYIRGELSEETREKVHSFLLPEVYNFGTLVREKLESIKIFAPSHVFIFGDGVRFREILQMFISFDTDNNPFREKPILAVLLPKDLDDNMSFPKGIGIEYTAMRFLLEEHYAKKTH